MHQLTLALPGKGMVLPAGSLTTAYSEAKTCLEPRLGMLSKSCRLSNRFWLSVYLHNRHCQVQCTALYGAQQQQNHIRQIVWCERLWLVVYLHNSQADTIESNPLLSMIHIWQQQNSMVHTARNILAQCTYMTAKADTVESNVMLNATYIWQQQNEIIHTVWNIVGGMHLHISQACTVLWCCTLIGISEKSMHMHTLARNHAHCCAAYLDPTASIGPILCTATE